MIKSPYFTLLKVHGNNYIWDIVIYESMSDRKIIFKFYNYSEFSKQIKI